MKISEINAEARKNGLSYGQYMAQKHMEENKELFLLHILALSTNPLP